MHSWSTYCYTYTYCFLEGILAKHSERYTGVALLLLTMLAHSLITFSSIRHLLVKARTFPGTLCHGFLLFTCSHGIRPLLSIPLYRLPSLFSFSIFIVLFQPSTISPCQLFSCSSFSDFPLFPFSGLAHRPSTLLFVQVLPLSTPYSLSNLDPFLNKAIQLFPFQLSTHIYSRSPSSKFPLHNMLSINRKKKEKKENSVFFIPSNEINAISF